MHLNYYALHRLVAALQKELSSATFVEAFSQEKDELILCFIKQNEEPFYIRATLTSSFTCLSFPNDFKRSRRNSVNQFNSLSGRQITSVKVYLNERAFHIAFGEDMLLFKMHGNRSNILLFEGSDTPVLFKSNLVKDENIKPSSLHRGIERSKSLYTNNPDLHHFYPTFGALPKSYLQTKGFQEKSAEDQWELLEEVVHELENNPFYLITNQGKPALSLLPTEDATGLGYDALEAYNAFYQSYTRTYFFKRDKERIHSQITRQIRRTESYIQKSEAKLQTLTEEIQPDQIADIIMANLHQIPANEKRVTLYNFYQDKEIDIKLNPQLSPQKNAENYYRKSKNRRIEVEKTEANVFGKYEIIESLKDLLSELESIEGHKALKQFIKANQLERSGGQKQQETLPYKSFEFEKYKIWVGKNAKANDQLTLKHAYKEDLWLHAKDVPGSHILIKYQSGKAFPKQVIERAAELAAFYSKRKNDSLIPVIVTPAKFVRKRKGSPAGQVIVSKEEIKMVPSRGPSDDLNQQ